MTARKSKLYDNSQLFIPRRTVQALDSLEKVRKAFALPANASGLSQESRMAMDSSFDATGGYSAIYESLQQHATELGQFPMASFVGYGALQQIAQQGMIRACVQTVADDMTRKWIEIKGGEDVEAEKIDKLKDLVENKYHLRQVFHKAFTTCGYMGGAFVYIKTEDAKTNLPLALNDLSAELQQGKALKFIVVDPVNTSPLSYNCTDPLEDDYMRNSPEVRKFKVALVKAFFAMREKLQDEKCWELNFRSDRFQ